MLYLRKAKATDAPLLTQIAFAAKAHWGYPQAWDGLSSVLRPASSPCCTTDGPLAGIPPLLLVKGVDNGKRDSPATGIP